MRQAGTLYYLLTDHLGSTALVVKSDGSIYGQQRYHPYGTGRPTDTALPTDYRFTGQLEEGTIGLYDYGARFYDPLLGRFLSADTVVPQPGNPQALNRYSYVLNNPLKYTDPGGNLPEASVSGEPVRYEPRTDPSAFDLAWAWLLEQCPTQIIFDEGHSLTRDLMRDKGVNEARDQFYHKLRAGTLTNGTDDYYGYKYFPWDYWREGWETVSGYDQAGFFLGSYSVRTHLSSDGTVIFRVSEDKSLESGSRSPLYFGPDIVNMIVGKVGLPGKLKHSNWSVTGVLFQGQQINLPEGALFGPKSVFESRKRGDPGVNILGHDVRLGSTVTLIFIWREPLRVNQGGN